MYKTQPISDNPVRQIPPIFGLAIAILLLIAGGFVYLVAGRLYPEGISFGSPMKPQLGLEGEVRADKYVDSGESVGLGNREHPTTSTIIEPIRETDAIFEAGFADTGIVWSLTEENWSAELKQNPLCTLRASYCTRVGYAYADFGCGCFTKSAETYDRYTDTHDPFTIYYGNVWRVAESIHSDIIEDQKLSIQRQGAVCAISYGRIKEQSLLALPGAYGDTVEVDGAGLQRITVPYARATNDEERAAGYMDAHTIALPHFPYQNSEFGLLLTSFERQPLLETCAREFDDIYSGVTIHYPQTSLNVESVGELHIPLSWYTLESGSDNRIHVLFYNEAIQRKEELDPVILGESAEIEELGSGVSGVSDEITDPMIIGNTLYYIDDQKQETDTIKAFDLFDSRVRTVGIPYDDTNPVHSFFVEGDWVYYLSGTFCNEYMYKCSLNLDRYDMVRGATEHLASGLSSRDIDGFNAEKNILYMNYMEGDAGCEWGSYEAYDMATKSVQKIGEYTYCDGDATDTRKKFVGLVSNLVTVDHLVVRNGAVSAPEQKSVWDGSLPRGRFIRVNVSR